MLIAHTKSQSSKIHAIEYYAIQKSNRPGFSSCRVGAEKIKHSYAHRYILDYIDKVYNCQKPMNNNNSRIMKPMLAHHFYRRFVFLIVGVLMMNVLIVILFPLPKNEDSISVSRENLETLDE